MRAPVLALILASAGQTPVAGPDFQREVRPLLADRCFPCHGPDAASRAADLRLDRREGALEAAVVPGDPDRSLLVRRILAEDPDRRMPPPDSGLELDAAEREVLVRWIAQGAPYDAHWAFVAPARRPPPPVEDVGWLRDPLDRWILARMERSGARPAASADPETWLRRVHLVLTGLPPSVEDQRAFLEGARSEEQVVDALLSSWEHAEHATARWLDLARYADTYGYQNDRERRVWPWRDWVLEAWHGDLAYDQFVVQQVAGDLLPDATRATRLATAFSRLHRMTNEGGSVEEEFRVESVADRVNTLGTAFLGLTLECARCHDHKFDPITQREYFGLFAFLDDIDEAGLYSHFTDAVPTPALDLPTPEQEQRLAELEQAVAVAEAAARAADLPAEVDLARGLESVHLLDGDLAARIAGGAPAELAGEPRWREGGLELSGDDPLTVPGVGHLRRSDPFSISLRLWLPSSYERAVVLHRSRAWTDAASRGYELLVEEGRASAALVHFWPGDAVRVRTREPLAVERWLHLCWTHDGSGRAAGMRLFVDGREAALEVVRDHLTRTIVGGGEQHLTLGERFRDRGLAGGRVAELVLHRRPLAPEEVARLAAGGALAEGALSRDEQPLPPPLEALRAARAERDAARDAVVQIMTMRDGPAPRTAHVLARGSYDAPTEPVEPHTPAVLPPLEQPPDRLGLARWLVDPRHPLTARVEVDRLWRMVFGRGLVGTPEDLGLSGEPPELPEVLDELALDLVEAGWSRRAILRRLVLSSTFRQALREGALREGAPHDPWFGRRTRTPLDAEAVRDSLLAAGGLLVRRVGGPPVKPYQPDGIWREVSGQTYPRGRGDDLWRRSLYTFWKRTAPPPAPLLFGAPSREVCVARRARVRSPQQALALWNDPQAVEAARVLANRALEAATDDAGRLEHAVRAVWSRAPREREASVLVELLAGAREHFAARPEEARALVSVGEAPPTGDHDPAELAAWTTVTQVLWQHEEATTVP